MASYSLGGLTGSPVPLTCFLEIYTTASVQAILYEFAVITNGSATGQRLYLSRTLAPGVGPTAITLLPDDSAAPAANTRAAISWGGNRPREAPNPLRRWIPNLSAGVGQTIIWTFPRGLIIPVSSSIGLFSVGAGSAVQYWVNLDE